MNLLDIKLNFKLFIVAIPFSLLKILFEKYIFSDWDFLAFLVIIIGMDTFFGMWKYYKLNLLSSKGFSQFFTKCIVYFALLVLTHLLVNFTVNGKANIVFGWIDNLFYSAIVVREAISILENITAINPKILPAWILKRFKQFDDSGNLNDLTNNDTKTPPTP